MTLRVFPASKIGDTFDSCNIAHGPLKRCGSSGVHPLALDLRNVFRHGHAASTLKVGLASHMHINENSQDALNTFYPYYARYFLTHTPSHWPAQEIKRADYEERAAPHGAILVGSPQQIIDKNSV